MSTKTFFINSTEATYNDNEFAWFQSLMLEEGMIGNSVGDIEMEVTENAVPDMSVLVALGKALVEVTISARTFKVVVESDAEEQVLVPANATGFDRVDAVIIRVDKDVDPNALKTNVSTIELVLGTGAIPLLDSEIDTAVGDDGWYRLYDVTVTNGDTEITNSQLIDRRSKVLFSNGLAFEDIDPFGGDGSDGDLIVSSGTTTIDLSVKEVWNYNNITISAGATLNFSNGTAGDKVPVLKVKGNLINDGTITTKGLGVAGGIGGATAGVGGTATDGTDGTAPLVAFNDLTLPDKGLGGGGASNITGGVGGAIALSNATFFALRSVNGAGGGGGGGGTAANVGTPGAGGDGGAGSLGLVLEIAGDFTNSATGIIELDGGDGVDGVDAVGNGSNSWNSGSGGGGGGGGAGSLVASYGGIFTNAGTISADPGPGGTGGSSTNTGGGGGSPVNGAGGAGGSGGATSFEDTLVGGNGGTGANPPGGAGSDGGKGFVSIVPRQ